jgi:hypothetical protein
MQPLIIRNISTNVRLFYTLSKRIKMRILVIEDEVSLKKRLWLIGKEPFNKIKIVEK